ncbi:substrate-binding domain-containing protein [Fibrella sp. HMF5335]|uniref:Substrate-binding domain-containing protein n=1 Tax=Fibrella rubiginis TaxID=2817060 RepID=A0A939K842_9BACT|nr:substrate-binding domain-containing protein [Fibrella rubiginis]MBO0939325.1 substrate-binding domain-containing protein [Fibrella rubiginis]
MKSTLLFFTLMSLSTQLTHAQATSRSYRYDPPWNAPISGGVAFTVPGIDNVPDLYGDINDPQLIVFMGGNQFMVVDELLAAFRKQHPQYERIFVETLPPGILAEQIKTGSVVIGNMRITLRPDVYLAGKGRMEESSEWFTKTSLYARNKLAIMVQKGNPKGIRSLADLGRADVRVSMPDPKTEGIGRQIEQAYELAGGKALRDTIMTQKVKDGSTFLTQIHHRQTPFRVLYDESDAGPVWVTEVLYQQRLKHPVDLIEIPESTNRYGEYWIGQMKNAPHPKAGADFANFLNSAPAQAIYKKYDFLAP